MLYRLGVDLGDIVIDGAVILGDGVNVAARLQERACTWRDCRSERPPNTKGH